MITVVVADDHQVVRRGIRALLEAEADFQVAGEAGDGVEAVRLVERLHPHVLVLDVQMPGLNGLDVCREVTRTSQTRVVVLSVHATEAYVLEALRSGAGGYVLKDATAGEIVQAVREVAAGRLYLSSPLSQRAVEAYARRAQEAPADPYDSLTTRERQVLQLVAEGCTNAEVGERLHISPRTVETHRARLMDKLGLGSHAELIRYAIRRGLGPGTS